MTFSVVYDACVLHPMPVCDLLMRVARSGLVRAHFSERILDECFRTLKARRPELSAGLDRRRAFMIEALPAAIIEPDDTLTASIRLPDENDAHVVMTAIRSSSQAIVTYNLKDFPANVLMRWDLEAVHPDDFIIHQLDLNDELIADIVRTQAADLKKPPMTEADLIARLADNGLLKTASRLRSLLFHETLP